MTSHQASKTRLTTTTVTRRELTGMFKVDSQQQAAAAARVVNNLDMK